MANLVIRPATGAGNKVVVQDQAGAAVLTTADSGATIANATLTAPTVASMANFTFPAGHVIQVVHTHLTTASSTSLTASTGGVTGYANITDLNCTITPKQSNSNMLVHVRWNGEASAAQSQDSSFGLNRDSTALGNPAAASSRRQTLNCISQNYFSADAGNTPDSSQFSFFDTSRSAGTSAITYHATCQMATTCTLYTNRTNNYGDNIWDEIMTSTIIIEEIAG
jgi:hypothetical protein